MCEYKLFAIAMIVKSIYSCSSGLFSAICRNNVDFVKSLSRSPFIVAFKANECVHATPVNPVHTEKLIKSVHFE